MTTPMASAPKQLETNGPAQGDREAAARYLKVSRIGNPSTHRRYKTGEFDDSNIVQAFAAHRLTSTAKLEARVVELAEALQEILEQAAYALDFYNRNGPEWTSPTTGYEYYSAGPVLEEAEQRRDKIAALLAKIGGDA